MANTLQSQHQRGVVVRSVCVRVCRAMQSTSTAVGLCCLTAQRPTGLGPLAEWYTLCTLSPVAPPPRTGNTNVTKQSPEQADALHAVPSKQRHCLACTKVQVQCQNNLRADGHESICRPLATKHNLRAMRCPKGGWDHTCCTGLQRGHALSLSITTIASFSCLCSCIARRDEVDLAASARTYHSRRVVSKFLVCVCVWVSAVRVFASEATT